jgi:hypothetical protein
MLFDRRPALSHSQRNWIDVSQGVLVLRVCCLGSGFI